MTFDSWPVNIIMECLNLYRFFLSRAKELWSTLLRRTLVLNSNKQLFLKW